MSFVSYLSYFWAIRDSQTSPFLDGFFYISHAFRMQAFFLVAGYFAHLVYHRQGPKSFINHRAQRILIPFLLFMPITYVLTTTLWVWGQQQMGIFFPGTPVATISPWLIAADNVLTLKWFDIKINTIHLWFLYYLLLFCLTVFLVRPLFAWLDQSNRIRTVLDKGLAKLAQNAWGGLALGVILVLPMQLVTDWIGVNLPNAGFILAPAAYCVYGLFFAIGWLFHRQPALITELKRFWKVNLFISIFSLGHSRFSSCRPFMHTQLRLLYQPLTLK